MKKIILTENVIKALNEIYGLAERFVGHINTRKYWEIIENSIAEEEKKEEKENI